MFEIDDKLFGYISKSGDLTEDIVQRYKNSLIFIGDEKQIYVPTTNSYVGVGTSTLEEIKTSISSSDKIYISDYANNNLTDPNTTYYFPVINNTVPHTYYHTYVALNVGVNPVAGKFIGGLQGTADYATVSDLTYKITTKVSSENRSYYVPFVNQMNAESYAYTNNRLLYNPHQEVLISTYFSGTLRGRSTYAEYAYHATYTTYTTYSIFNSYQSIHRMDNVSSNYHITFASNNSYSLSYIDDTFYYNPLTNCVYAGNFYGTFHGDTDLFESVRGGNIIINGNALIQENTYVKIGTKELGSGYSYQYIISYLDGDLVSTYENNLRMYVNINGIPINKEITYLHATYLGNVTKEGLFTQFENTSNQTTRITIGGTTKDLQIESYKTLVSQKTDNTAYPLVFTNATNSSGSGDLYKNYSNLLYNPYKQSLSSGLDTEATGNHSFATGSGTKANGENSVAEGYNSIAGGGHSHVEGSGTKTLKGSAHAEGMMTIADGVAAHAEGSNTTASGDHSHAEGSNTTASGENSHASGLYTLASHINESAFGKYNASNNDTLFSVGIGTASNNRINAFEVTTDGKVKAYDGFYKNSSDNTYLLLGGGGHKLLTDLFTQFSTESNQITRITIGGETKDLQINADTLDGYHLDNLYWANIKVQTISDNNKIPRLAGVYFNENSAIARGNQITSSLGEHDIAIHAYNNNTSKYAKLYLFSSIAYFNGSVGIGITSPSYKLHVIGSSTDFSTPISSFQNDSDTSWLANAGFISPNITAGHYTAIEIGKSMDQGNVGHLSFYYAGNDSPDNRFALGFYNYIDLLVVKRNGNVGIGTASPSYKLHVDGNIYASGFRHSSVNSDDYVLTAGGGWKQWTTNNTASAIVARDSNGNISGARYYSNISDENINIGSVYIRNTSDDAIRRISLSDFISKITSLVDSEDIVSFDKTLKVTEAWMDTGIITAESNFPKGNGTYAIQISHSTLNNGSDSWPAIYSGIITIYNGTNGSYTDEVILHRSGHEGGKRLYLRTIQTASSTGYCKIQIAASANFGANAALTFKFRKLI